MLGFPGSRGLKGDEGPRGLPGDKGDKGIRGKTFKFYINRIVSRKLSDDTKYIFNLQALKEKRVTTDRRGKGD